MTRIVLRWSVSSTRCARAAASTRPTLLLAVTLLAVALVPSLAAQDFSAVEIQTVPVATGLHMLVGRGGNMAVSTGEDGPVLIDDQFAPLAPKILAAVAALQDAPLRFVVNTHWHGDHTGGNEAMGKAGALLVAHDNVRKRMATDQVIPALGRTVPASPAGALPVITFSEGTTLHWNGGPIEIQHVAPAHTDGDSIVWFPHLNAVHTGDCYFSRTYPYIDVASGGSIEGMIAAADAVLERADDETKIIPGHGPLSNAAELRAYREMLVTVRDRAKAEMAAGKDVETLVRERPFADLDPAWGGGFLDPERFIRIVYADLSR